MSSGTRAKAGNIKPRWPHMNLQPFFLPTTFKSLVWKTSVVLHLTPKYWQLTHQRGNDHFTQLESALLDGKDGGTSWCESLVCAAALACIGDVKKSKVSCKFSGQGCKQEGKWAKPLLWLSPAASQTWGGCYLPFWVGASSPTMAWTGAIAPKSQSSQFL